MDPISEIGSNLRDASKKDQGYKYIEKATNKFQFFSPFFGISYASTLIMLILKNICGTCALIPRPTASYVTTISYHNFIVAREKNNHFNVLEQCEITLFFALLEEKVGESCLFGCPRN